MIAQGFWKTVLIPGGMILVAVFLTNLFSTGNQPTGQPAKHTPPSEAHVTEANDATIQINYAPAYSALDPLLSIDTNTNPSQFDPQDDYWGLPRSKGSEETAAYCTACHSLRIVMQQRQSRDGWDYLLTWMTEKQGMAEPFPEDREILLDYLTREFGVDG
ncbi:MAG: hypothetical protein DHS20C05_24930 [Hyphococcus sp.]|nr:MAG: hypothetical protein DHS20C05_24930 [Marinicaulis sp.]